MIRMILVWRGSDIFAGYWSKGSMQEQVTGAGKLALHPAYCSCILLLFL
jgi:hypothetical protein